MQKRSSLIFTFLVFGALFLFSFSETALANGTSVLDAVNSASGTSEVAAVTDGLSVRIFNTITKKTFGVYEEMNLGLMTGLQILTLVAFAMIIKNSGFGSAGGLAISKLAITFVLIGSCLSSNFYRSSGLSSMFSLPNGGYSLDADAVLFAKDIVDRTIQQSPIGKDIHERFKMATIYAINGIFSKNPEKAKRASLSFSMTSIDIQPLFTMDFWILLCLDILFFLLGAIVYCAQFLFPLYFGATLIFFKVVSFFGVLPGNGNRLINAFKTPLSYALFNLVNYIFIAISIVVLESIGDILGGMSLAEISVFMLPSIILISLVIAVQFYIIIKLPKYSRDLLDMNIESFTDFISGAVKTLAGVAAGGAALASAGATGLAALMQKVNGDDSAFGGPTGGSPNQGPSRNSFSRNPPPDGGGNTVPTSGQNTSPAVVPASYSPPNISVGNQPKSKLKSSADTVESKSKLLESGPEGLEQSGSSAINLEDLKQKQQMSFAGLEGVNNKPQGVDVENESSPEEKIQASTQETDDSQMVFPGLDAVPGAVTPEQTGETKPNIPSAPVEPKSKLKSAVKNAAVVGSAIASAGRATVSGAKTAAVKTKELSVAGAKKVADTKKALKDWSNNTVSGRATKEIGRLGYSSLKTLNQAWFRAIKGEAGEIANDIVRATNGYVKEVNDKDVFARRKKDQFDLE